jgi:AraC-like DNA-binding protein
MPLNGPRSKNRIAPGTMPPFAESLAWQAIGEGWRPLFGRFQELGFSFEWHDFRSATEFDWSRSFHPGSVELCLNLAGSATLESSEGRVTLAPRSLAFYHQGTPPLKARRGADEHHQFITVEFSKSFLSQHFKPVPAGLHPLILGAMQESEGPSGVSKPSVLGSSLLPLIESLRHPPVFAPAQELWFRCKALELAAQIFFQPAEGDLFCTRQQRAARERVDRVRAILTEKLSEPPPLEELGRLVGCSPFYLSRLFSQEAGMTIQQYLRQIRMERAAELLRTGKCNVTEAALEVGYNSLSHFSSAFHETFGCCPGLYPLRTPTQKAGGTS